jgi:hypothetical protein
MKIIVLLLFVLAVTGCATKYRIQTDDLLIETTSVRKFGEFEGCWKDANGADICVKAMGVDRQSASPLEEAAAEMFRRYADLVPTGGGE